MAITELKLERIYWEVTHKRLITLGITRVQDRSEEFESEEKAMNCVRALQRIADHKLKMEGKLYITEIQLRQRQVWVTPWISTDFPSIDPEFSSKADLL